VLEPAEIDAHAETFQRQAFTVLDEGRTEVRRNGEWLDMEMEALFRLARTTTVAQLLAREDFAKRYGTQQPISILELLYPLLQGYDSVAIDADVELGGTDQTFNLLLGREIQQAYAKPSQSILTMPILPGTDGVQRMSKSTGNYVGVTEPPEEIFGKLMSVPDEAMAVYHDLLLDEPFDPARHPNESKRLMARLLTARFHGDEAAQAAEAAFDQVHQRHELPDDIAEAVLPEGETVHLPALLREHFGVSASEARRLIAQGGVKIDGNTYSDGALDVAAAMLDQAVLQLGKRRFMRFRKP
jgi:tyrosyl-tRNA synthetase